MIYFEKIYSFTKWYLISSREIWCKVSYFNLLAQWLHERKIKGIYLSECLARKILVNLIWRGRKEFHIRKMPREGTTEMNVPMHNLDSQNWVSKLCTYMNNTILKLNKNIHPVDVSGKVLLLQLKDVRLQTSVYPVNR